MSLEEPLVRQEKAIPLKKNPRTAKWLILGILSFVYLAWSLTRVEVNWPWYGLYPMLDPDSLLYLRWLEQSLLQGKLLVRDLYMAFPAPYEIQFPPLYREFLYRSSLLLHLLNPSSSFRAESLLGIVPPLSGVILQMTILAALFLRKSPFALVAFTGFSMLPGFSHFTTFDYFQLDHHWLEVNCIGLWLLLGDWFCERPAKSFMILGAVLMAVFMGTWSGSPQFVAIILGLLLMRWIFASETVIPLCEYFSGSMLVGAGVMALFLIKYPETAAVTPFSGFGWVQVGLIAMAGIAVFFIEKMKKYWPVRRSGRLGVVLLLAFMGIILIHWVFPSSIEKAGDFFSKRSRVIKTISEMRPVLDIKNLAAIHGQLAAQLAYWGIFPLFFAVPIIWLAIGKQSRPGRLLVEFSIIAYVLSLYQIRFSRWLAPGIPLLTGIVYYQIYKIARKGLGEQKHVAAAAVIFPFMLIQIGLDYNVARAGSNLAKIPMQGISWLRDKTPVTSGYGDDKDPEYGVVSFWDQGNAITYLARRPVAVSNTLVGFKNLAKIFFAENETAAYDFCRTNKYRYLYLTSIPGDEEYFRYLKGLAEEEGEAVDFDFRGTTPLGTVDNTWKSLYFWLYGSLGLKEFGPDKKNSRHFRIIFVSTDGAEGKDSSIKIVEVVPGATLTGTADPGSTVQAGIGIRFGRSVSPYAKTETVNASGSFRITVAYPSGAFSGGVQTGPFYSVIYNSKGVLKRGEIQVPDAAIACGSDIPVAFPD